MLYTALTRHRDKIVALLVDGRGVPLSPVVTGAHRHDVTQLDTVLSNVVIQRPERRSKHLCADTAYVGEQARATIERHGYIPHVVPRKSEIIAKKRNPNARPRRWVVEVAHSWFNQLPQAARAI